jgi:acetyl-CoA carboxylase carboxyl transferase subunit beta
MPNETRFPRIGSAVIVVDGDRVLLGARGKEPNRGKWILPGGKIEPFESIGEAARREIREETGLEIELEGPVTIKEIINPPGEHRVIIYSRAQLVGGQMSASSDLEDVRFCSKTDLRHLDLSAVVEDVLGDLGWLESEPMAA